MKKVLVSLVIGVCIGYALQQHVDTHLVTRIIDGDTFVIESGQHIRILGINAAERGEPSYEKAKSILASHILNRRVHLRCEGEDDYRRSLCWIWR